jgi:hypothetical protein
MHSFEDSRGHLWVACSECTRGGNGDDKDKCSCGFRYKRFNKQGCFSGTLMPKYKDVKPHRLAPINPEA